jgi:integrase/recombinase XerC
MKVGINHKRLMTTITSPKISQRLPSFVDEKGLRDFLIKRKEKKQTTTNENEWETKTDKLILSLLYQTGMRLSELITLKENISTLIMRQIKVLG